MEIKEVIVMLLVGDEKSIFAEEMKATPDRPLKVGVAKRKGLKRWLFGHFRKVALLVVNAFINHDAVFAVVGLVNKKFNFLSSVFVAYPASEEYALAYVYPRHRHIMRWLPWPAGIFKQNGKWGLMTVISSTEKDFNDPVNIENLGVLVGRTEKIKRLLGASQKTFAGILPGVLYAKGLIGEAVEAEVTVEALIKAEADVRKTENYPDNIPLVILGGEGFIGNRFVLRMKSREVYSIDLNGNGSSNLWPVHLRGRRAILINLTRKAVLSQYLGQFWRELVLLNEVYPEPSREELTILKTIGSPAYHVVGVISKSYPSFPKAYHGGIPCCAAWNSKEMKVITRKLN